MSIVTVVECVTPPPVPVTVRVWSPTTANLGTSIVRVDFPAPGAAIELGLKVTPVPDTEEDKAIAESKPPETVVVIVVVPELPAAMVIVEGEALMVKLGFFPVTVNDTVVVAVVLPEVPFTVML